MGSDIEVQTLALIVPDSRPNAQVLIGTNTLNSLYSEYTSSKPLYHQPMPQGYRAVLQVLEFMHRQGVCDSLGWVSLNCQVPETIPAGKTVVLEGSVRMSNPVNDRWVIVEAPQTSTLPGGILVSSCLLTLPAKGNCLPIVLKNESQHDVIIPPKNLVAEVNSIQSVIPKSQDTVDITFC